MVTREQATHTKPFSVIVVNNFVSPTFRRRWMKRINELSFTVGKGGKTGAFIRNCSTTNTPASMLIGKKHVYEGVVPDEMEADIINTAIYLAKQQQTMIENMHGLQGNLALQSSPHRGCCYLPCCLCFTF